jgi:hypothetical protein
MVNTFNCSEYNPKDYNGKKLMVFENDGSGRPCRLSTTTSSDGKTFTLARIEIGVASAKTGKAENQITVVGKPIDKATLPMLEKSDSRFTNGQYDFVLFLNSPRRKAQYTESKTAVTA